MSYESVVNVKRVANVLHPVVNVIAYCQQDVMEFPEVYMCRHTTSTSCPWRQRGVPCHLGEFVHLLRVHPALDKDVVFLNALRILSKHYRVLPALKEDVPTPPWRGSYMKTNAVDVNAFRTPVGDGHIPSWPNGLLSSSSLEIHFLISKTWQASSVDQLIALSTVCANVLLLLKKTEYLPFFHNK